MSLVLDDVGKIFPTQGGGYATALRGVDMRVQDGEFLCVLGASGCGKTTVLNLVAGFMQPTYGAILVDGNPVRGPSPERGVVFQQHALFPWMSVGKNVDFGLSMTKSSSERRKTVVEHYLRLVGLWEQRSAWPKELSGGMKQRVAIARALANDPKVLLMDEPFGALDAQTRRRMQGETERIWLEARRTTLFVTHSIDEAILLGDRIALMAAPGHVVECFEVDLPRPRDELSPEFVACRRSVEAALTSSMA